MYPRSSVSILGLTLLALCFGCGTMLAETPRQQQQSSVIFAASKDRVWPLLVSEVGLEYPVRVIERESGLISTDWVTIPAGFNNMRAAQWIIPLGGFLATWEGLRMNMKVMAVEIEPGKTQVTVNCHYEAFESNVRKTWLVAESNGSIESAILSKIEARVFSATAAPAAPAPKPVAVAEPVATPAVPPVQPPVAAKSPAERLLELKKLLDAGAITQDEYAAKRKVLVDQL